MSPTLREDNELPRYLYPFFEKERFNESKRHLSVFLACKHVTRRSYWTTKVKCEENYISISRKRFGPRRNFPEKVAHRCLVSLKHVIVNIHLQDLKFTNQEKLQYGRRAVIVNNSYVQYIKILT